MLGFISRLFLIIPFFLYSNFQDSIQKRDKIDSTRKNAPLQCPIGAIFLDTSELDLNEVIDKASDLVREALSE